MRIACPACAAEYDVPPDRMSPGRNVRCAKCGVTWAPVPATAAAEPLTAAAVPNPVPESVLPEPEKALADPIVADTTDELPDRVAEADTPVETPEPTSRRGGGVLLVLAWLVTFAALGAAGYAAVIYRTAVIHAWPPSARAYAWAGLGG